MPRPKVEEPSPSPILPPDSLCAATFEVWRFIDAKYIWKAYVAEYLAPLFKTLDAAQCLLDTEGPTILDRFQQRKPNPAAKVARDLRREILDFADRNLERRQHPGHELMRW